MPLVSFHTLWTQKTEGFLMFLEVMERNQCQEKWVQSQKQPSEVICKTCALTNIAKLIGEHLCWSLFFDKVVGLRAATLLKKTLRHNCFQFWDNFKNTRWCNGVKITSDGCFWWVFPQECSKVEEITRTELLLFLSYLRKNLLVLWRIG